ncbi:hypothetical protein V492_04498 [Pseudogymnoascus sp. VKM F-4246]|nr:hypothetical protein V492_04498 [Pseudogymnoascus sp. VKM F-4246]
MKLTSFLLSLAAMAPSMVAAKPVNADSIRSSTQRSLGNDHTCKPHSKAYDDSRVRNYHDKKLLCDLGKYFSTFVDGDYEGMRDLQADGFHITDIRKSSLPFYLIDVTLTPLSFSTALAIVRSPKDIWYEQNKGFSSLMTNVSVEAISVDGSSCPGSFSVLENVVRFTLAIDPPEEAKPGLPPGIKKGESSGMIMMSVIWWGNDGQVIRDLEYGRLIWDNFDINAFDTW